MADLTLVANGGTKPLALEGGRFLNPGETTRLDLSAYPDYVADGALVEQTDRKPKRRKSPSNTNQAASSGRK